MSEICIYIQLKPKNKIYVLFLSVRWFHTFDSAMPEMSFNMDTQIDQFRCVTCVEKVSRWNSAKKNIYKKGT